MEINLTTLPGYTWLTSDDVDEIRRQSEEALDEKRNEYLPQLRKDLKAFAEEFPLEVRREFQRSHLLAKVREARRGGNREKIAEVVREMNIFLGKIKEISQDQIDRAREYPIGGLIKVTRGMAVCPFHNDKTPSMDVRKNFYHCYGCGAHGDVIDLAMKLNNLTFAQAIIQLT